MKISEWPEATLEARQTEWRTLTEESKTELRQRFGDDPVHYALDRPSSSLSRSNPTAPAIASALNLIGWIELLAAGFWLFISLSDSQSAHAVWAGIGLVNGLLFLGFAKVIELLARIADKP